MPFRKPKSLKHVSLPIAGHTLVRIAAEHFIALMFSAPDGLLSQLRLDWEVIMTRPDGSTTTITSTKPGSTWNIDAAVWDFSSLIGEVVISAVAHADGQLEVTFEEGTILQVHPDDDEAWHFQQPAPGSMKHYPKHQVMLSGYAGGLI